MAGSKFQYDESGGTFFYFLLSFLALVVIPCTYYFWPGESGPETKDEEEPVKKKKCRCEECIMKHNLLKRKEPWKRTKDRAVKFILILGWIALAATAYKVTNLTHDYVNWDPFEILQVDPAASTKEIKKAYHRLSQIYHPDKPTGDEKKFLVITKAYAALTDDDARKNWELYGNPDGPGATSFGIALPSWIVEKENSILVLGLYALVFMIALPTIVGIWWYNSVKYGGDEVLLDTTQLYYYLIHKTPHMVLKRVIMIIGASPEFEKSHNSEIIERPSDNYEVPALIRELPNLNEKNRERPLCFAYSLKARSLIYAHLSRMHLPPNTLEIDKACVLKKFPLLIQEFVQCVAQMTMLALAGRISRSPSLDTLEAAMKLSPLIIQAVWDSKSPLLQLPHITEDMLRYFSSKKGRNANIRSVTQLAAMKEEDRRSMLRALTDDQYEDVITVLGNMPLVEAEVKTEVLDDEESGNITAGSIVTVTVALTRKFLSTLFVDTSGMNSDSKQLKDEEDGEDAPHANGTVPEEKENTQPLIPVWDKKGKLAKKLKKAKNQQKKARAEQKRLLQQQEQDEVVEEDSGHDQGDQEKQEEDPSDHSEEDDQISNENDKKPTKSSSSESESESEGQEKEEDDEDWERFQRKQKKKDKSLESKKISHSVHCPFFPEDKQEFWWIYLADKKKSALTSIPVLLTNLVNTETIDLKLTAPSKPGIYHYSVIIRSDSYIDFDIVKPIKLDVKEAKIVEQHPQWEMSDNEEEEQDDGEESAVEDSDLLDETDSEDGKEDSS